MKGFLSTALLGALFLSACTLAGETCDGHTQECPDLLGLPVEVYRWHDLGVAAQCGRFGLDGCAKIMANSKDYTRCVIHIKRNARKSVLKHEMNHCRGWTHGDTKTRKWRKINELQR